VLSYELHCKPAKEHAINSIALAELATPVDYSCQAGARGGHKLCSSGQGPLHYYFT